MDDRFQGKVAVVTGGGRGIGAAVARRLAFEGATAVVIDIDRAAADAVAHSLERDYATKSVGFSCDVSDAVDVDRTFGEVVDRYGRLDVLVANAGVNRDNLIHKMSDDDWSAVIATNLTGTFLCCRAAQRPMVKNRYGKIVCISSRSAVGSRGQTNYSAAKAGIQGIVKTLAIELGPFSINVNGVAPGHVETAMTRSVADRLGVPYDDIRKQAAELNAIKRVGTPEDVAAAVAFLASDEASYVTGQILYVAGRSADVTAHRKPQLVRARKDGIHSD